MARKQRVDSASAAITAAKAARELILPPAHSSVPEAAMPFWSAIVAGRAREEWAAAPALLSTAASLAWTQWQIAQSRGWLDGTEELPGGQRASVVLSRLIELQRLEMAYLRTLQQHGRAVSGEVRDVAGRRAEHQANVEGSAASKDGLLN